MRTLVIVESPAKAKTIKKQLPRGYQVEATMGHVIDLPKSRLGIDVEHDFKPDYITIRGKGKLLAQLKKDAKKSDRVLLATDPDREGEAISWHVANTLGIDPASPCRIEFHEITKRAINDAIDHVRSVDMDLVNAQQTRRLLDRIVGYSISPFLWKKVRRGLSAGRVQSVVTRIIVDREKEIESFVPEEYWNLNLDVSKAGDDRAFLATFYSEGGKTKKIPNAKEADRLEGIVKAHPDMTVLKVQKRKNQQRPPLPFTTSTLQQRAYQELGFTSRKTMSIAQRLYESGRVTYIRTDSTRLAPEAIDEAKDYILENFGEKYLGNQHRKAKKNKNVQDAHEAIRPASLYATPDSLKTQLEVDDYKLYRLIWQRMAASQMAPAVYAVTNADIACGDLIFKVKGDTMQFDGFTKVMPRAARKENPLPVLEQGDAIHLEKIHKDQKFTNPPARYNEASLIKLLEERGIGRPSTYAPTIATIKSRNYVEVEDKRFKPTDLGITVTNMMEDYFPDIVDPQFTAKMETELDNVANGSEDWVHVMEGFYGPFKHELEHAQEHASKIEIKEEVTDVICDKCGAHMVVKEGRYGKFLACPNYPKCKNTKPYFEKTGGICPKCGGDLVKRKSKKGRTFYGCSNYPSCDFVTWDKPVADKCPKCGNTMFQKGLGKRKRIYCLQCEGELGKKQ
ncbi:type I DNA topoisomerase [Pseudoramibacter sp.]|jgi:DNA topoisomerase-1|uniref:type I DNA topoisomerase n=1 Tax=Pseudoramibacter sp. TaxID=2034862 RepID=UPI0025D0AA75|nr:type I DNA topoisomerase [Pseudoramibacter sp.]MCH4073156.1 type I DNA topoisomerase [Pseudoramibacter sp.]MCH4106928.1 type I DNA topoisomerase [Pseudoramibacter sp.]